ALPDRVLARGASAEGVRGVRSLRRSGERDRTLRRVARGREEAPRDLRQRDQAGDRLLREAPPAQARLRRRHDGRDRGAAHRDSRAAARTGNVITLKTPQETAKMHEAGRIVAEMLAACRAAVRPGVTTGELDRIASDILKRRGATSNFLHYAGVNPKVPFPATICTSVNEQIVHGIPGKRRLKEGEIVSIDAGA